jgi:hypothetical protein
MTLLSLIVLTHLLSFTGGAVVTYLFYGKK